MILKMKLTGFLASFPCRPFAVASSVFRFQIDLVRDFEIQTLQCSKRIVVLVV